MNALVKVDYPVEAVQKPLRYFCYSQNNSGGSFQIDDRVTMYVFVQARNAEEANSIAETKGLYFDGEGDCPCCGDRWSSAWRDDEGDEVPMIYNEKLDEIGADNFRLMWVVEGEPFAHIYHYDGSKTSYVTPKKGQVQIV